MNAFDSDVASISSRGRFGPRLHVATPVGSRRSLCKFPHGKRTFKLLTLSLVALLGQVARGNVTLPRVFGDSMVLQAEVRLPIWGTAKPGEQVTVSLGSDRQTAITDATGKWQVELPPQKASDVAATLHVRGNGKGVTCKDVLIGEVWVCAGQSNMEWPLGQSTSGPQEVSTADESQIRLLNLVGAARGGSGSYTTEHLKRLTADSFSRGSWQRSTPATAKPFSAVGFYFGKKLHEELGVPVGLISPAIGGTPAEAWIRRAAIAADEALAPLVEGDWLENPRLDAWCQQRAASNLRRAREANETIPGDDLGANHSFKPGFMWDAGVQPLLPFAIRGVLWYQGESNAASAWRARQYSQLFSLLVRDWRSQWKQGDFPLLYVQLPALNRPHWPLFRESQRRLLDTLPNLGMVVTMDVGHRTNVHPTEKRPVGHRLARWALAKTYGQDITPSGPMFRTARMDGQRAVVDFEFAKLGLQTRDRQPPTGFEIAGEDGQFQDAAAIIDGDTVIVTSPTVSDIRQVRYGWSPYPTPPLNLINHVGLPASPFTTAALETSH